ncbi:MAG: SPOR domain-containing protein [Bdellovibrionales bacterium]
MASQKGGSKADTLVKVVLIMFISLFSFSVGTFVGKQVSDSDHRRMALEGEYGMDRQIASTGEAGDAEHGGSEDKITPEEVESLTAELVNREKAARETAEAEEHESEESSAHTNKKGAKEEAHGKDGYKTYARGGHDAHAAHGEDHEPKAEKKKNMAKDATYATAEKLIEGKAPTDGHPKARKPASTLPSVASSAVGKYTVQVASFADEKEAKAQAADLKGKGWNAFYLSANVNGRTWYRVLVGLFDNYKSAQEFRAQFMKDSDTKSAIVQKIVQ